MRKRLFTGTLLLFFIAFGMQAQKITITSGSLDALKGQKNFQVKYDYSNMAVGKYDKEAEYVDLKTAEGNAAEPGKGDNWKKEWYDKRTKSYEPMFEELFNKGGEKSGLNCSKEAKDAEYIMDIHTTFTDVGYFIGVSSKPSYINTEISFIKASSGEKVAVLSAEKCPGVGGIHQAYAKLGKTLAPYLDKNLK